MAVGENGQGKTNLLEGLYYLFALESPRASADEPLVRRGAESAFVRGEVITETGKLLIEVEVRPSGANRMQLNRSGVRRKRDVRQVARAVFFGPDDIAIVQGDPGERRRFMDAAVAALWPAREAARTAYDKALRQRNRLLKDWDGPGGPPASLEAWDDELVRTGAALLRDRAEAVEAPPGRDGRHLRRALRGARAGGRVRAARWSRGRTPRSGSAPGWPSGAGPTSWSGGPPWSGRTATTLPCACGTCGPAAFASHGEAWAGALCLRLAVGRAVAARDRRAAGAVPGRPVLRAGPGPPPPALGRGLAGRGQTVLVGARTGPRCPRAPRCGAWRGAVSGGADRRPRSQDVHGIGEILDALLSERAIARGPAARTPGRRVGRGGGGEAGRGERPGRAWNGGVLDSW